MKKNFTWRMIVALLVFGTLLMGCPGVEEVSDPPTGVTATSSSPESIEISWVSQGYNVDGRDLLVVYQIWRSDSASGTYTVIGSVADNRSWYTDSSVIPSTTYYYKVDAKASDRGRSPMSDYVEVRTMSAQTPKSVSARVLPPDRIEISFQSSSGTPALFYIWRSDTEDGTYTLIGNVTGAIGETYADTGLSPSTYYYKVSAVYGGEESELSSPVSATLLPGPGAPQNFVATALTNGSIQLSWSAPLYGGPIIYYYLYYLNPANETYECFDYGDGATTTYTDTDVVAGYIYDYKVSAENSEGEGPLSSSSSATSYRLIGGSYSGDIATGETFTYRVMTDPGALYTQTWYVAWQEGTAELLVDGKPASASPFSFNLRPGGVRDIPVYGVVGGSFSIRCYQ